MQIEILGIGCAKCKTFAKTRKRLWKRAAKTPRSSRPKRSIKSSPTVLSTPALVMDGQGGLSCKIASFAEIIGTLP